jgi:hypothetical protein
MKLIMITSLFCIIIHLNPLLFKVELHIKFIFILHKLNIFSLAHLHLMVYILRKQARKSKVDHFGKARIGLYLSNQVGKEKRTNYG